MILLGIALSMGIELAFFAISKATMPSPSQHVLDFQMTRNIVAEGLSAKHRYSWVPGTFFESLSLCTKAVCCIFVTVSFISLRFNVIAYGVISFLWTSFFYNFYADRVAPQLP
jgi:hypothetical protein